MNDLRLTPSIASANGWDILAHCDKCRLLAPVDLALLLRQRPELDLADALMRGRLRCSRCKGSSSGLSVTKRHVGKTIPIMKLTPGLSIERLQKDD